MKHRDIEFEQIVYLGGQISGKHPEFAKFAQTAAITGKAIWFLENMEKIEKEKDPVKAIIGILENFGKIDQVGSFSELSRLSMIVGDPRKRISMKEEIDKLRQSAK
jgi:hypothetical protein